MPQGNNIKLSIIIPVYNEEQYILALIEEIKFFFNLLLLYSHLHSYAGFFSNANLMHKAKQLVATHSRN